MSQIKTDQQTYYEEWRAYFVTGQKSLDSDWDTYVAGFEGVKTPRQRDLTGKVTKGNRVEEGENPNERRIVGLQIGKGNPPPKRGRWF